MAVAAEARVQEEYGKSLSLLRRLGHAIVHMYEEETLQDLAFADFETAVAEMLKTDKEFRGRLEIDKSREHPIVEGRVCAEDGTPMVAILQNGAAASQQEAIDDWRLQSQADRDAADVRNAERVDNLAVGMTRWGLSLAPEEELHEHPDIYEKRFGYRKGLTYIQSYSRVDEDTLIARSYSVDMSDEQLWREVLSDHGMVIPDDASTNRWLDYSAEVQLNSDQADKLIRAIRRDYYAHTGARDTRYSINDYVEHNIGTVRQYFDAYYVPLSVAIESGTNQPELQDFAYAILGANISQLKAEVRSQLIEITQAFHFSDDWTRLFDSLIRYAVAEDLRRGLVDYVRPAASHVRTEVHAIILPPVTALSHNMHQIHMRLANGLRSGVEALRSYGGCPGNAEFSNKISKIFSGLAIDETEANFQEAFGGKTREELSWHGGKIQNGTCVNCKKHTKVGVASWCKACIKC